MQNYIHMISSAQVTTKYVKNDSNKTLGFVNNTGEYCHVIFHWQKQFLLKNLTNYR